MILTSNGKGLALTQNSHDQGRATRCSGNKVKDKDEVNILRVEDDKLLIAGKNGLGIRTKFSSFLPRGGESKMMKRYREKTRWKV